MARGLHLVFGGELVSPDRRKFRNLDNVEVVGLFPDYASAYDAWKEASQRSVDSALTRYFIAKLYRLLDENKPNSEERKQ